MQTCSTNRNTVVTRQPKDRGFVTMVVSRTNLIGLWIIAFNSCCICQSNMEWLENDESDVSEEDFGFMEKLLTKMIILEVKLEEQISANGILKKELETLRTKVDQQDFENLTQEYASDYQLVSNDLQTLREELKNQEDVQKSILERVSQQQTFTGFSAYATEDRSFSRSSTIAFDTTTFNLGEGFDTGTSTFTCPVDGVYMFTVSVLDHHDQRMEAVIQLNGQPLASAFCGLDEEHSATASVVTNCLAGDTVNVICGPDHDECIYYGNQRFHGVNTFSGALLYMTL